MIWVMQVDNEKELPKRKRNRLENYDYSSCGAYFITVCTLERQNYFWENVGAIIDRPQVVDERHGALPHTPLKVLFREKAP